MANTITHQQVKNVPMFDGPPDLYCLAGLDGYVCTRRLNHEGQPHVAHTYSSDGPVAVAAWWQGDGKVTRL